MEVKLTSSYANCIVLPRPCRFTIAIVTDVPPCSLINGIRIKWEENGGGKLQVKDLQSQESKVVLTLHNVFTGTHYSIILKTLESILRDATSIQEHKRMALEDDKKYSPPQMPGISLRIQVPRLKGVDTLSLDKLPYHVKENRKVLYIETDTEDEKHLQDLIQFAKEHNVLSLFLGKHAGISKVMDKDSTPGEIKRMVKCAMGNANYQSLMTGKMIFGINLINGEVAPSAGRGKVSLQMVLFTYFKMEDKYSVFAELHQSKELGPVLAIIPPNDEQASCGLPILFSEGRITPPKKCHGPHQGNMQCHTCSQDPGVQMGPQDADHYHPPQEEGRQRGGRNRKRDLVEQRI